MQGDYVNVAAKLDTGNDGPNLITTTLMRAVHAVPDNSGYTVYGLGGKAQEIGRSFWLKFSGRDSLDIVHEKLFHHVDEIGKYGILFNKEFVNKLNGDIRPPTLLVRGLGHSKKTKGMW
jgi:hypothetical protein